MGTQERYASILTITFRQRNININYLANADKIRFERNVIMSHCSDCFPSSIQFEKNRCIWKDNGKEIKQALLRPTELDSFSISTRKPKGRSFDSFSEFRIIGQKDTPVIEFLFMTNDVWG